MIFVHHERYQVATQRGVRVFKGYRRLFITTRHHEFVLGW